MIVVKYSFCTKNGPGHNWEGTSVAAEIDMLDELLREAKNNGLVVKEQVTDKNSSVNETNCNQFSEGILTFCAKMLTGKNHTKCLFILYYCEAHRLLRPHQKNSCETCQLNWILHLYPV